MSVLVGNCVEVMARFPDGFFDSIVTDPPYGLKFMGKKWDNAEYGFHREWADQAIRVLKPGGHLLSFGGTRTYHRMASAVEDAGFEIRDMVQWLYGQGFPKSMNVGKAIDKAAGKEREVIRERTYELTDGGGYSGNLNTSKPRKESAEITAPATPEAAQWEGWGTGLKPAQEPIVLARKPLIGTVAKNVLEYGTGAMNIDATRVGTDKITTHSRGSNAAFPKRPGETTVEESGRTIDQREKLDTDTEREGRWPANVILDEEAGAMLDEQTGIQKSGTAIQRHGGGQAIFGGIAGGENTVGERPDVGYGDSGGASRFFYCAKASKKERNAGLDDSKNGHPTVKPIDLMRYLIRLVTPPDGKVLDPFVGSGTTGIAAQLEGFKFVGIEMEVEYVAIARARIKHWKDNPE